MTAQAMPKIPLYKVKPKLIKIKIFKANGTINQ